MFSIEIQENEQDMMTLQHGKIMIITVIIIPEESKAASME